MMRPFGGRTGEPEAVVTESTIKTMATLAEEDDTIEEIEKEIIHRVFEFGDAKVKDVMIPMKDVGTLPYGIGIGRAKRYARNTGYSRIPVIDRKKKIIKGILYSKDLLGRKARYPVNLILRPPFVTHENEKVTDLFDRMNMSRTHLAVVINRSRRMVGIVTLEDMLEEIVGEIYDEYESRDMPKGSPRRRRRPRPVMKKGPRPVRASKAGPSSGSKKP
jgi:CBS domain containing-hemolysin-like protein